MKDVLQTINVNIYAVQCIFNLFTFCSMFLSIIPMFIIFIMVYNYNHDNRGYDVLQLSFEITNFSHLLTQVWLILILSPAFVPVSPSAKLMLLKSGYAYNS